MATINEQIVIGRKFRKLIDESAKLWQRISFWTKASDVEFNDGMTAETKLGAIDGITDSLVSTSSRIAASAKALNTLNNNLMSHPQFICDDTGKITGYKTKVGADTVFPFNCGDGLKLLYLRYVIGASAGVPYGSINIQFKNESGKNMSVDKNAIIYGYSGTEIPSFDSGTGSWSINVPKSWEKVTGTDISKYQYIWIRYTFSDGVISKRTASFID